MDRDDFIITVYCLVCDHYRAVSTQQPIRHGGFAPQLTDEEVITFAAIAVSSPTRSTKRTARSLTPPPPVC
jgi:hypothetical protein